MRQQRGFTLIELLVVVFIMAMMGSVGYQMLATAVRMSDATARHAQGVSQTVRALHWLQSDIEQYVTRPVRDELGESIPSLVVSRQALALTHTGRSNVFDERRSQLQRVSYQWDGEWLQRVTWPVLDRKQNTSPHIQRLLMVERFSTQVLTAYGWHTLWPRETVLPGEESERLPVALRITLVSAEFGEITRTFEMPQGLMVMQGVER